MKILTKQWWGQILGFNYASGPYPMMVTGEFQNKEPHYLEEGNGTFLNKGFGGNTNVYSIITHIIQMGASIPWKVQTWNGGKAEDLPNSPLYDSLLENPNPDQSWEDFIGTQLGMMAIFGEALTYQSDIIGVQQWYPLNPDQWVLVPGGRFKPVDYWHVVGKPEDRITPEEMLHAKLFNPLNNSKRGMSPIRAGLGSLTEDDSAIYSSIKAFQNQGPGIIIAREKGNEDDVMPLTAVQARELKERIEDEMTGIHNARKTHIIGSAVSVHQLGLSPVDLNILAQRQYTRAELCNLWHFPVELLNDNSASTYNNLSEMHKAAYLHAVIPLLYKLRGALNKGVQRVYGPKTWITPDLSQVEVLQQNKKEMTEWLAKAYWIKVSRKQELMGEEMDTALDYYADANGQPLPTPDEAREQRLGGPPLDEEEEDTPAIRIAKELQLGEYGQKVANGNGTYK